MDLVESAEYLRHHLALALRDEPLFADDAIPRLHRVATGLPRQLANAATAALTAAAENKDLIDDACGKKAVAELTRGLNVPTRPSKRAPPSPPTPAEQWSTSPASTCVDSVAAKSWDSSLSERADGTAWDRQRRSRPERRLLEYQPADLAKFELNALQGHRHGY